MGAAEPRYVHQSPGLVENCVGLYVPLLEFNQLEFAFPQEDFYSMQHLIGDLALEKKLVQASIDAVKHASDGANYLLAEKLLVQYIRDLYSNNMIVLLHDNWSDHIGAARAA